MFIYLRINAKTFRIVAEVLCGREEGIVVVLQGLANQHCSQLAFATADIFRSALEGKHMLGLITVRTVSHWSNYNVQVVPYYNEQVMPLPGSAGFCTSVAGS